MTLSLEVRALLLDQSQPRQGSVNQFLQLSDHAGEVPVLEPGWMGVVVARDGFSDRVDGLPQFALLLISVLKYRAFIIHHLLCKIFVYLSDFLLDFVVVAEEGVVFFDNVANFGLSQAISQDFGVFLDFDHEFRVAMHNFADFSLKVGPYFLFVLHDVLCLV